MGANQSQSSSPAIEEKFVAATNSSQKPLSATEALARLSLRNSKKAPPTAAITLSVCSILVSCLQPLSFSLASPTSLWALRSQPRDKEPRG